MKPKLLIVDDDEDIRSQMKWALAEDYEVLLAEDRESAQKAFIAHHPLVVLLDLGLPPHPGEVTEGMNALSELLARDRLTKVIVITGQSDREHALRAIGEGAYDFMPKPVDVGEIKHVLKRVFHVAQLERECREMRQRIGAETFEGMLGSSPQMQELYNTIRKVSTTDAPVLILGESGTGKEMAALAIHQRSHRKDGPFVAINCGAIPEALLESELFGHEKGAFTGAHMQRKGRIETASGGTLFLDEIGELSPTLQVKLLRFLQEQTIERIGGRSLIEVDARVVAATNSDLKKAMAENKFREDLYYRLAVVVMRIPPLRERSGDILVLAKAFLQRFAAESKKENLDFHRQALMTLTQHAWPGNVRELENRVKRAVIMAEGRHVTPADLELELASGATPLRTLKEARESAERGIIELALKRHNGKIAPAASELGISRPTLYELMEKLGMRKPGAAALDVEPNQS